MNKLFTITEPNKQFVKESTTETIKNLASMIGYKYWGIPYQKLNLHAVDQDEEVKLCVIEAAYLNYCDISTSQLRAKFPNTRIVALGSDTMYYLHTGQKYQFDHPADCDLFLDQMVCVVNSYLDEQINADYWLWSASEWMVNKAAEYIDVQTLTEEQWLSRPNDVISVLAPWSIHREGSYRKRMVEAIREAGYTFTQGSKDELQGHDDQHPEYIYQSFLNSKFNLMTCSHDNADMDKYGCMKGWRDAFGILFGCVGICDGTPNYLRTYGQYCNVYPFGDFNCLNQIIDTHLRYPKDAILLQKQQYNWVIDNTIEKQLKMLLERHRLI